MHPKYEYRGKQTIQRKEGETNFFNVLTLGKLLCFNLISVPGKLSYVQCNNNTLSQNIYVHESFKVYFF